jgi:predicted type IV restriction endonuclease/energy-coupling factor transporter ATP-binding protein EcfA2
MNLDESYDIFLKIFEEIKKDIGLIETEEDARFMIIKRLLVQCLGWDFSEVSSEKKTESGYTDILLRSNGANRLVIEAKRIGFKLLKISSTKLNYYKINGAALSSAKDGVLQARKYCIDHGVSFSIITNGVEWIGCYAVGAGKSPDEGKAIVFPDLECVKNNYSKFYELISKEGVCQKMYQMIIAEGEGLSINNSEKLYRAIKEYEIHFLKKSDLASDLESIFSGFFSLMSGESDRDMLAHCFVESKESKEADKNLEKITRNLINQVEVINESEGAELLGEIRSAIETERGEFVLIIGNKGAGKSTFIDRFFKLILANELRGRCLLIRVDLGASDGDYKRINGWLISRLKEEVEREIFGGNEPEFNELQGVFYKEYNRWKNGELRHLYEKDKEEFKIQFGQFLRSLIADQPEQYIVNMLEFAIRSRKVMPCLVFDNTDHFEQVFQERVFQFAQSIHRRLFSFIICPITDKTVWQLSKSGPLQSYITKSFYLPIPNTKEILRKRVSFIKSKIDEDKVQGGTYFLKRGIRMKVSDINAFAACIEEIFINTDYTSRTISWLCNHDIRRGLILSKKIVTSPWMTVDDLVKAYLSKDKLSIGRDSIRKSIIFGDYNHYSSENNDFVMNVFSLEDNKVTTPLIKLSILKMLIGVDNNAGDDISSYISIDNIVNYFEPMGIAEYYIYAYVEQLLKYRLITPYDPSSDSIDGGLMVKVTHSGKIHMEFSLSEMIYITSMALVTALRRNNISDEIREIDRTYYGVPKDKWLDLTNKFISYCLDEDKVYVSIPTNSSYEGQHLLRRELAEKWGGDMESGGSRDVHEIVNL